MFSTMVLAPPLASKHRIVGYLQVNGRIDGGKLCFPGLPLPLNAFDTIVLVFAMYSDFLHKFPHLLLP